MLGLAGAGVLGSRRASAQRDDFVPAIVIGSGFGGAVAALRLGEAGIDTWCSNESFRQRSTSTRCKTLLPTSEADDPFGA